MKQLQQQKGGSILSPYRPLLLMLQKKIRVNAVAPGLIQTSLTAPLLANPDSLHLSEKMHPLGRLGKPLDVAKAIAFLLDTENDWITGQILAVDGGLSRIKKGS